MKLKTKLYLSFGAIFIILAIFLLFIVKMINTQNQNMNTIVRDNYEMLKLAHIIENETNNTGRLLRTQILDTSGEISAAEKDTIKNSRTRVAAAIDTFMEKDILDKETRDLVIKLNKLNDDYTQIGSQVARLVEEGKREEATELLFKNAMETRLELLQTASELKVLKEGTMGDIIQNSVDVYEKDITLITFLSALFLGFGAITMSLVVQRISRDLRKVTTVIGQVDYKSKDKMPRIELSSSDEVGEIAVAFNEMASTLEESAAYEREYIKTIQDEKLLKTQIAEITAMLQGIQDLNTLAKIIITKLATLTKSGYGVIYIVEEAKKESWLTKLATYAYDDTQQIGLNKIYMGQGIVGQCAIDKKSIRLSKVPENYTKVSSGLGEALPQDLIVLPVQYEGRTLAVVELASINSFGELELRLMEEIINNLGIVINSVKSYMEIARLLRESQALTEELQVQSEELTVQQEELQTINEKLEDQYQNSEQKTRELEKTKKDLEDKNEQVVNTSKYKSEFLANMSHELRTPLNSLLILAQMLAENKNGNLTETQVEYANTITSSGEDLLNLINEILDLSKVEAGKMEIDEKEVLISDIKDSIEAQFIPLSRNKVLGFKIIEDEKVPLSVFTDDQRLGQILKNLLANAFKFTEVGEVALRIFVKGECLVFAVSDTGIGIPKDKKELIFEAFQQGDGTTGRKYGGTGLGLSISRELAQLLGGHLEVESVAGKGSTFSLYLPIKKPELREEVLEEFINCEDEVAVAKEEEPKKSSMREKISGKKILVVDDDIRNIYALSVLLENKGLKVLVAENGQEALLVLEEHSDTDLVLMDIMMPEMDGYQTMGEIRKIPSFKDLPIIALTAKAMKQDREKCIQAGASDYISKPVNLEQLLSLIRVWLE